MSECSLTYHRRVTPRAPALAPDDRRAAIVAATLPLVLAEGRAVTTRQIAEAAGVAEGTIFRVFATKDDVIDAVFEAALDMEPFIAALEALPSPASLDEAVHWLAQAQLERFAQVFSLMTVLGIHGPPKHQPRPEWIARLAAAQMEVLAPFAEELTLPPREVVRYIRLLAFAGGNSHITDGELLTAAGITTLVLDGSRKKG